MPNAEITNLIFTKDGNYAYKLRNKLNRAEFRSDYVSDTEALLYFMFKYDFLKPIKMSIKEKTLKPFNLYGQDIEFIINNRFKGEMIQEVFITLP